ncbi:23S rRNA (guanosine(2251)-2'-O)-methyltransferase RlmB [Pelagibaculum spongiae]|uniref:23S rRNA (guanosine-2'-O-)-methyltransferase RlmB n=1 Tax=Pelagibaculum spongiae TaxID=2080658 RepID=A0A2V1GYK7_9GAMM|nr:23S rRNA (guanosine(2251)-2'-O)-methyltransferase RlmB [Pelagibaculum spongiae]PVZ70417.1 23S rRNA (guanosine(2251)-2'-O)-methyltransferase RlmB [Pelagibaculum spongiae]
MKNELVYGLHAVQSLLKTNNDRLLSLAIQGGRSNDKANLLADEARKLGCKVEQKSRKDLDTLTNNAHHQGVVAYVKASGEQNEQSLEIMLEQLEEAPFLLVLDGVTDPHNLGACLRSANAAGVHGVIVPKDKAVGLNATVRKVACGAAEATPLYVVTNLARCLDNLKKHGIWLTGTAGEAEQSVYQQDLKGPMAIVMGAEGSGLRRLTREACDFLVNLPMAGEVSSLNVSVATGVCLFEAVRQRQ